MLYYSKSGRSVLCKFEKLFEKDVYDWITIRILRVYLLPSDSNVTSVGWSVRRVAIDNCMEDGGKEFLPRCTALYLRMIDDSVGILLKNAMHLGKKFLAAIFSSIVYGNSFPWKPQ